MKMSEDENITKYVKRIKANVSDIKSSGGAIEDVTVPSKVLRTLLPIYVIRVSGIPEMKCDPNNKITLDALVGRLIEFELDNYDNYTPSSGNLDSAFKAKVSLKKKATRSKRKQSESEEEDSSISDIKFIEAFPA